MRCTSPAPAALALALALLAGCQADRSEAPARPVEQAAAAGPGDRAFWRGTPRMRADIKQLMGRVPGASARSWADIARRLTSYGEIAVPPLSASLRAEDPDEAIMAAYVLGMIRDPRALDALQDAVTKGGPRLRHEAATAMLRMGDRRALPALVQALEDADPLVRARAILVLRDGTGETFDYRADDDPVERSAAVARWRAWLTRTGGARGS